MEPPLRRACNRCHTQKLSCKRVSDEPCERCIRLKTECKSSPSLRFRRPASKAAAGQEGRELRLHKAENSMLACSQAISYARALEFDLGFVQTIPSSVPMPNASFPIPGAMAMDSSWMAPDPGMLAAGGREDDWRQWISDPLAPDALSRPGDLTADAFFMAGANFSQLATGPASIDSLGPAPPPNRSYEQQAQGHRKKQSHQPNHTTLATTRLFDISTALWELSATLPAPPSPERIMAALVLDVTGHHDQRFPLNNLFSLSQQLLETFKLGATGDVAILPLMHAACSAFLDVYDQVLHFMSATASAAKVAVSPDFLGCYEVTANICQQLCFLPEAAIAGPAAGGLVVSPTPSMRLGFTLHLIGDFLEYFIHITTGLRPLWLSTVARTNTEAGATIGRGMPCLAAPQGSFVGGDLPSIDAVFERAAQLRGRLSSLLQLESI